MELILNIGMQSTSVRRFKNSQLKQDEDDLIAIEKPVALIYNGISHVVMMATPKDLEHFALGFSLTEKIIESPSDIFGIDIIEHFNGIEIHVELSSRRFIQLKEVRRNLAGRTGCGICGSEQIDQIFKPIPSLSESAKIKLTHFNHCTNHLKKVQIVGADTGCTHAAVWLDLDGNFIAGFEDVGRHVALDKLLGFRAKQQQQQGAILVSSRASYEMVQKVATCNIEILLAVSAVTSLAVAMARQCNLTLVGFFRDENGVIYTDCNRIIE